MDVQQIQSGLVGMALFDAWADSVAALHGHKRIHGDPLIAAAFAAFEGYVQQVETQNAAMIAGVSSQLGIDAASSAVTAGQLTTYTLNPAGNGVITQAQMAPLLALNLIA
jgi:hypothetical protein